MQSKSLTHLYYLFVSGIHTNIYEMYVDIFLCKLLKQAETYVCTLHSYSLFSLFTFSMRLFRCVFLFLKFLYLH